MPVWMRCISFIGWWGQFSDLIANPWAQHCTAHPARGAAQAEHCKTHLVLAFQGAQGNWLLADTIAAVRRAIAVLRDAFFRAAREPLPTRWNGPKGPLNESLNSGHLTAQIAHNVEHCIGWEVPLFPEGHQHLPVPLLHLQLPDLIAVN